MDAARIGNQHLFGDIGLARHHHQLATHQIVEIFVLDHGLQGLRDIGAQMLENWKEEAGDDGAALLDAYQQ